MPRPLETLESKIDQILALLTGGTGAINSVQTGYVNAAGTAGAGEDTRFIDTTITAVNTAKSIVIVQPAGSTGAGSPYGFTGRLTSTTNVRVSSVIAASVQARWYVVEFK